MACCAPCAQGRPCAGLRGANATDWLYAGFAFFALAVAGAAAVYAVRA